MRENIIRKVIHSLPVSFLQMHNFVQLYPQSFVDNPFRYRTYDPTMGFDPLNTEPTPV